jgi:hypothetical protein
MDILPTEAYFGSRGPAVLAGWQARHKSWASQISEPTRDGSPSCSERRSAEPTRPTPRLTYGPHRSRIGMTDMALMLFPRRSCHLDHRRIGEIREAEPCYGRRRSDRYEPAPSSQRLAFRLIKREQG